MMTGRGFLMQFDLRTQLYIARRERVRLKWKRSKRAIVCGAAFLIKAVRHIARIAQIPSASLGAGSSLRNGSLLRMTTRPPAPTRRFICVPEAEFAT
jgi:hypothetical protein